MKEKSAEINYSPMSVKYYEKFRRFTVISLLFGKL